MPQFRLQDLLDILIMSILLYQLYAWFRKGIAIQLLAGLGTLTAIYFVTRETGLHMTSWALQQLGTVVIVMMVVVFQNEIRQTLYRFSKLHTLMGNDEERRCASLAQIAGAAFNLARRQCGALLVFQRRDRLEDHLHNGVTLDALISEPLLQSIFQDRTPLHDGAALIANERLAQAGCLLPLSSSQQLPQQLGTRHRAAIGLTEQTDALVLVVSEERGEVSLAENGRLTLIPSADQLEQQLMHHLQPEDRQRQHSLSARLFSNLLPKSAILLGVSLIWLLLANRQGEVTMVPVPLTFHGLPTGMTLVRVAPEEVTVKLRSTSGLAPSPRQLDLTAAIDLSAVPEGQSSVRVSPDQVRVPAGMIVVGIEPSIIRITVRPAPHKSR